MKTQDPPKQAPKTSELYLMPDPVNWGPIRAPYMLAEARKPQNPKPEPTAWQPNPKP